MSSDTIDPNPRSDPPTFGVLRVLTCADPAEVATHGRIIEANYPAVETISECIPNHPNGIPSAEHEAEAIPAVKETGEELATQADAVLISCTLDPAIEPLSNDLDVPVVGAGRSVAAAALTRGDRIGTLTLESGVPSAVDSTLGDRHHATTSINGAETTNYLTTPEGKDSIITAIERLAKQGCDVVVPACTGISTSGVVPEVRSRVDPDILDPVVTMAAMGFVALRP